MKNFEKLTFLKQSNKSDLDIEDQEQATQRQIKNEQIEAREEFFQEAKEWLINHYNRYKDTDRNINEVLNLIKPFLGSNLIEEKGVIEALEQCKSIEDKDQFLESSFNALKPIFDLRFHNEEEFRKLQRQAFVEARDFIKINEVLSYGYGGDTVHIHLAPPKGVKRAHAEFINGLKELAKLINEKEELRDIKYITAASPLISMHGGESIMKNRLGFTNIEAIDEEERKKHFPNEKREVKRASISREDFLNRYLEK